MEMEDEEIAIIEFRIRQLPNPFLHRENDNINFDIDHVVQNGNGQHAESSPEPENPANPLPDLINFEHTNDRFRALSERIVFYLESLTIPSIRTRRTQEILTLRQYGWITLTPVTRQRLQAAVDRELEFQRQVAETHFIETRAQIREECNDVFAHDTRLGEMSFRLLESLLVALYPANAVPSNLNEN